MKLLNRLYDIDNTFILMSGAEHIGKSTIARLFVKNKPSLYFSAKELCDELTRREFTKTLYENYRQPVPAMKNGAPEWKELFQIYADTTEDARKVLVLDNLEFIIRANPKFPGILKNAWERILRPKGIMLIAIIRSGSVLINLEQGQNPLLKVVSLRMNIEAVPFLAMLRDYPHRSFEELVSLYAITGGVPMYWHFFDNAPALVDQLGLVRENMLTPTGWFYDEPVRALSTEVYEPIEYLSVLQAIAYGYQTLPGIANYLSYRQKDTQEVLENLIGLNLVETLSPVTEKHYPKNKVHYAICQPFYDFWFTFVFPKRDELRVGKTLPAYEVILKNFDAYAEYWFTKISTEIFLASMKQKKFSFDCDRIGPYWDQHTMIDIIGIDDTHKKIFFGECVYADASATLPEYLDFKSECKNLPGLSKYKNYEQVYGLFVTKRPDRELIDYAMNHENVLIFEGTTLYRMKRPEQAEK